ncbi:MAG: sigma-70 family RNA polymerase sigma factor [Planctomycetes bacterium]|nr:sigma-70 family RNA polymerase sigma factor [Planctomycetota bacterium]
MTDDTGQSGDTGRLVQEASAGDSVALDGLLSRYLPELHAFVRLRAGGAILAREQSEDLVQSVCREVLEDVAAFEWRGEQAFKRWLYLTAQNKIVDRARYWRSQKRDIDREEAMATNPGYYSGYRALLSPSGEAIRAEQVAELERAFDELSEEHAQVITLAKILGLAHEQIAAEIGRTVPATRMLLHRALARLGVILGRRRNVE